MTVYGKRLVKPSGVHHRVSWCLTVVILLLLRGGHAMALPSFGCETVQITDRDGVGEQLGLPKLVEMMKEGALRLTADDVPVDIQLEFGFSSPMRQISATIRSWADKEAIRVESSRVNWHEDFKARRRVIQPMPEADAELFRQQILTQLRAYASRRTAAIALGSEPVGLAVVVTSPEGVVVPFNRNRTVAVLGCLRDGTELAGYVTWGDGHRVEFRQRANQTPGRFVVGSLPPSATQSTVVDEAEAATAVPPIDPQELSPSNRWRWWSAGLVVAAAMVVGLLLLRRIRK